LGMTAPFGTTILGAVALHDIRSSHGRITGLPLALADALMFPLLLLDAFIFAAWFAVMVMVVSVMGAQVPRSEAALFALPFALLTAGLLDVWIFRAAWRAANKSLAARSSLQEIPVETKPAAVSAARGGRTRLWKW